MATYDIERVAVIGAGNMGSGIAQKYATEGFEVILVDLDDARVSAGMQRIDKLLGEAVERRIFREERAAQILGRISGTADWERLSEVDLVVEAVFEDLSVKGQVFSRLSGVCKPDCILATNTSSFRVADVAAMQGVGGPERVIGLHYFYHPAKNRLVEVIGHDGADPAALAAAWATQEAVGKTPIHSADAPGFVVNRFFVPWLNEAVRLLANDVADIATIDAAAKEAFRIGMGPFELMNVTGVPVALHAATTLGQELGDFYAPEARLAKQVEAGLDWPLDGTPDPARFEAVADRLLGVVFHVAAALVDEGVATVEDTDIGARVGLRWSKGPFALLNHVGAAKARELADAAVAAYGMSTPSLLANADGPIPIRLVTVTEGVGATTVRIDRPDALNALNPAVGAQLGPAVDAARCHGAPLVVAGAGKAFVAGADVKFFVDRLRADDFGSIYDFTASAAGVLNGLSGIADAPVVARVHGLSLGGGSELALACDHIAATPKASFGFPETGIGIIPGLGGTQRLARRIGWPLAKWMVYTGSTLTAAQALELGLADTVASFAGLDAACLALAQTAPVERIAPTAPPNDIWRPLWDLFADHTVQALLSGAVTPDDPALAKALKRMGHKSAAALLLAERLMDAGAALPLAGALQLELDALKEVFGHPDALEGLSALIEGRRPTFV